MRQFDLAADGVFAFNTADLRNLTSQALRIPPLLGSRRVG